MFAFNALCSIHMVAEKPIRRHEPDGAVKRTRGLDFEALCRMHGYIMVFYGCIGSQRSECCSHNAPCGFASLLYCVLHCIYDSVRHVLATVFTSCLVEQTGSLRWLTEWGKCHELICPLPWGVHTIKAAGWREFVGCFCKKKCAGTYPPLPAHLRVQVSA